VLQEIFAERAAIMEFDGNLSREDAEHAAYLMVSSASTRENHLLTQATRKLNGIFLSSTVRST